MSASEYNFKIEQGSTFKIKFYYRDENGDPIDLTGYCARLTWRTNYGIEQSFFTENTDYSVYKFELDEVHGGMILTLPASTTNSFEFSYAKYDLELQSPDVIYSTATSENYYTYRLLYGKATIVKRESTTLENLECQNE
jgi:hypothetical protein